MGVFDVYEARINAKGRTKRGAALQREKKYLRDHLPDNLSYQEAVVDGEARLVSIANSDNLNEKTIFSLPDEDLRHGALVEWMDNRWLITERDANTTIYTKCKMIQCNYLLKWINKDHQIIEQWSVVSDGTKYLTGEFEDKLFMATRGDTRLSVILANTPESAKLDRQSRFLIDDPRAGDIIAYSLTKPLRMGWSYNGNGVFQFVLQEVVTTDDDNLDLMIADYYKHFPHEYPPGNSAEDVPAPATGEVWF